MFGQFLYKILILRAKIIRPKYHHITSTALNSSYRKNTNVTNGKMLLVRSGKREGSFAQILISSIYCRIFLFMNIIVAV